MHKIPEWLAFTRRIITIDSDQPDDARRRRLLNIILIGFLVLTIILVLIFGIYLAIYGAGPYRKDISIIFAMALGLLAGMLVIYIINRKVHGALASMLFLTFLLVVFNFGDSPDQLANGRSIILFSIPWGAAPGYDGTRRWRGNTQKHLDKDNNFTSTALFGHLHFPTSASPPESPHAPIILPTLCPPHL